MGKKNKKQLNHTVLESYFTILQSHQEGTSRTQGMLRNLGIPGSSSGCTDSPGLQSIYLSELLSYSTSCVSGHELPGSSSDSQALILQILSVARALH